MKTRTDQRRKWTRRTLIAMAMVIAVAAVTTLAASVYFMDYALGRDSRTDNEAMEHVLEQAPHVRPWIDSLTMSVQQCVENANFMAAFQKIFGCATADVASAASNKYFHDVSLLISNIYIWFSVSVIPAVVIL